MTDGAAASKRLKHHGTNAVVATDGTGRPRTPARENARGGSRARTGVINRKSMYAYTAHGLNGFGGIGARQRAVTQGWCRD